MSGFEILGIAASIIQIADIGAKVSAQLCTFYYQVKHVDDSVKSLSDDVSLTSNVLRRLGEILRQDEQAQVCSQQALDTAKEVLKECKKVFDQISGAINRPDGNDAAGRIRRAARKFGLALIERDLEMFRSNLERLKSTMLLMLNVIMYAEDIRKRSEYSVLQDHQDVIRVLVQQQDANNKRFDEITRAITLPRPEDDFQTAAIVPGTRSLEGSTGVDLIPEEVRKYHNVIHRLLQQVDSGKAHLGERRYLRIRNGIVNVHLAELDRLKLRHGRQSCQVFQDPFFEHKSSARQPVIVTESSSHHHPHDLSHPDPLVPPGEWEYSRRRMSSRAHGPQRTSPSPRRRRSMERHRPHSNTYYPKTGPQLAVPGDWVDSTDGDESEDDMEDDWMGSSPPHEHAGRMVRFSLERRAREAQRDGVDPVEAVVLSWTTLKGSDLQAMPRLNAEGSRRR